MKAMRVTPAVLRYLHAVQDWKAPYEIAEALGFGSSGHNKVKPFLGRLIVDGLVTWSPANNTYKATPMGQHVLSRKGLL